MLYNSISNLITVNSDVYAVYIRIQLWSDSIGTPGTRLLYNWNYLGVIDRSNCRLDADTPAVLLFSQVR